MPLPPGKPRAVDRWYVQPTRPGRWACKGPLEHDANAVVYDVLPTPDGLRALVRGDLVRIAPCRELVWRWVCPIPRTAPHGD